MKVTLKLLQHSQIVFKKRTQILKKLRDAHMDTFTQTQARLKDQKAVRKQICQVLRDTPKTILEMSEASGLPPHEILWHITAMKKYDLVREVAPCGEYFLYELASKEV